MNLCGLLPNKSTRAVPIDCPIFHPVSAESLAIKYYNQLPTCIALILKWITWNMHQNNVNRINWMWWISKRNSTEKSINFQITNKTTLITFFYYIFDHSIDSILFYFTTKIWFEGYKLNSFWNIFSYNFLRFGGFAVGMWYAFWYSVIVIVFNDSHVTSFGGGRSSCATTEKNIRCVSVWVPTLDVCFSDDFIDVREN